MTRKHMKTYITVLNVISAFSVVALHANGCFWQFSRSSYWFTANIIECVFYFAVPVFFMITGVTLFDFMKRQDLGTFFRHRFHKVVVPFLFWSIVAVLFQVFYMKKFALSAMSPVFIANGIFKSTFCSVYWFFWPLFSVYLSIPLFAAVGNGKKEFVLKYLAASGLIINFFFPFVLAVFKLPVKIPVSVTVTSGFLLYAILGWLIDHCEISPSRKKIVYLLGFVGLIMHGGGTYLLSMEAGKIIKIYKGYNNVPCLLYSVAVFIFIKEYISKFDILNPLHNKILKICNVLKNYTFPIYLLHWFLIRILVKELHIDIKSMVWRIGGIFLLCFLSIAITWLVRKIPLFGKRILP